MHPAIHSRVIVRNADNYAIWIHVERGTSESSHKELLAMLNAEIQRICNDHVSTLDDSLQKSNPRPNPVPRVFVEQGNDLSRVLWLSWEE